MRTGWRAAPAPLLIAGLSLGLLAAPRAASAAWPQQGRAISSAAKGQQHSNAATDGAGGAIIVWQDLRFPRVNVFAQHVLAGGEVDPAWPSNGQALLTDS